MSATIASASDASFVDVSPYVILCDKQVEVEQMPLVGNCNNITAGGNDSVCMANVVTCMTGTCGDLLSNSGSIELSSEAIFREHLSQISDLPTMCKAGEITEKNDQAEGDTKFRIKNEDTKQNAVVPAPVNDTKREAATVSVVAGSPRKRRKKMNKVVKHDRHEERWYAMIQKLIEHKKTTGRYKVQRSVNLSLHHWARKQQLKYTCWRFNLKCHKSNLGRPLDEKKVGILEREGLVDINLRALEALERRGQVPKKKVSPVRPIQSQSNNELSTGKNEVAPYLSKRVAKSFINGNGIDQIFFGTVKFLDDRNMYKVEYDDGDKEDAWEEELDDMIAVYEKNKNGDVKARECIDEGLLNVSDATSTPSLDTQHSSESDKCAAQKHMRCTSETMNTKRPEVITKMDKETLQEEIKHLRAETHELKSAVKNLRAAFQSDLHDLKTVMINELHEMKEQFLLNLAHQQTNTSKNMKHLGGCEEASVV